jgi:uncharacterized Zn finger protein (UPF0148 family)
MKPRRASFTTEQRCPACKMPKSIRSFVPGDTRCKTCRDSKGPVERIPDPEEERSRVLVADFDARSRKVREDAGCARRGG